MKRIREKISETDLWVDGGFYSEKDLRDDLKLSETLVSIGATHTFRFDFLR